MTVILAAATSAHAATCAPPKLVHIVLRDVTPGVVAGTYGAQPKTFYRVGEDKLRVEEGLDRQNGIHELIVVAEPNVWMINLFTNSGRHMVDPGPTFKTVAPVIGLQGVPKKLAGLELGCEADFLAANALRPTRHETIHNADFAVYQMTDGDDAIELLERSGTKTPAYVRYYHHGKLVTARHYDVFETGLPVRASLFVPPAGIHITEAGSQ